MGHIAKANIPKRFGAAVIDEFVATGALGAISVGIGGLLYAILQDSFNGRSIGRMLIGQVLYDLATHKPATFAKALGRNILALMTYIIGIGLIVDIILILVRPDGRKLADLIIGTQVTDI